MAMTAAEKKAYNKEYYQKYRKKGLKKGRKTGTKKSTESLVGLSSAGLNDAGKVELALIKQNLKKDMNAELAGAKTEAEKAAIRTKYHQKALAEVQRLKSDGAYAKGSTAKSSKSGSGKKSSGSSKSGGSSSKSSGASAKKSVGSKPLPPQVKASIDALKSKLNAIEAKMTDLSSKEKADLRNQIQGMITRLQLYISKQTR